MYIIAWTELHVLSQAYQRVKLADRIIVDLNNNMLKAKMNRVSIIYLTEWLCVILANNM